MQIGDILSIEKLEAVLASGEKLSLGEENIQAIKKSYDYIQHKMNHTDAVIYGINTGFGSLCDTVVPKSDLSELQYNLLRSHACGTGDYVPANIVKLMLLLKVQSLAYGYSGVNIETVQRLLDFYNLDIIPVVYQQGSLGASGDLAPLSHLCLPLIGEGYVWKDGQMVESKRLLDQHGLQPITLGPKEGLALINGTQFMSAYAVWALMQARAILRQSSLIAALSVDAFDARIEPFWPHTHAVRKQEGQMRIADTILKLLEGSEIISKAKQQVQDPYSYRCIPQVHGASLDALDFVKNIVEKEINAVTDNPNIFPDDDLVISGGNFHGQALALNMDFAAIALAELANISERRIYKLVGGERGLPPFLAQNAGLESGLMIAQYTAASIVSQNKQLCTPASVDSIVSSNGQEDHVSMGANAATKLYKVCENVKQVLAIEMVTVSRAMNFRRPLKSSQVLEAFLQDFRQQVPTGEGDSFLSPVLLGAKRALFGD
jgi:histidine ammonia-lyase